MKQVLKDIKSNFYKNSFDKVVFKGENDRAFQDFIREQHNGHMPNDFIFATISGLVDCMLDFEWSGNETTDRDNLTEIAESLIDVYNSDLYDWQKQFSEYTEQARQEFGDSQGSIEQQIQQGQWLHIDEIAQALYYFVKERAEESEEA